MSSVSMCGLHPDEARKLETDTAGYIAVSRDVPLGRLPVIQFVNIKSEYRTAERMSNAEGNANFIIRHSCRYSIFAFAIIYAHCGQTADALPASLRTARQIRHFPQYKNTIKVYIAIFAILVFDKERRHVDSEQSICSAGELTVRARMIFGGI